MPSNYILHNSSSSLLEGLSFFCFELDDSLFKVCSENLSPNLLFFCIDLFVFFFYVLKSYSSFPTDLCSIKQAKCLFESIGHLISFLSSSLFAFVNNWSSFWHHKNFSISDCIKLFTEILHSLDNNSAWQGLKVFTGFIHLIVPDLSVTRGE